ncbi:YbaK/EbsC family protein [Lysinibacillus sp. 54212]|uniref:YbaK/EbsC family protein n=1 Tax=Lysinibacillus sp. 54212 TaxID=3119829 RepID=UPI002FCB2B92
MAIEKVRDHFAQWDIQNRIQELNESSATVELAAQALGCEPERIAKTLSFVIDDETMLVVAAGDAKIDNAKFKSTFGVKAKMVAKEEVEDRIGHDVGGVCPFGVNEDVTIYLDESLKRFLTVFPACGSSNSAIELTLAELEAYTPFEKWVDVCKGWE